MNDAKRMCAFRKAEYILSNRMWAEGSVMGSRHSRSEDSLAGRKALNILGTEWVGGENLARLSF